MKTSGIIDLLSYAELAACFCIIVVMFVRKQMAAYGPLAAFLTVRAGSSVILLCVQHLSGHGLDRGHAYQVYFYVYWASHTMEALLGIAVIYNLYKLAMAPLKGLQSLGMLMFRWAAAIAVLVAVGMAFGPHVTATKFIVTAVSQLQQTQSILTLCLLLFVTFAIRPMGLSYKSRLFGVSFGLGIMSVMSLIGSAWIPHDQQTMFTAFGIANGVAIVATLLTWMVYFTLPEPKRRIIVLPTTSPFLRWNQISEALGDEPGYVAVGGVHPEIFAPAELEVMRRASMKMILEPISINE
ncbi:hypothetical protein SAMN05421770_107117 [Granulicella rosea]|uniref:Uncharacterized protein n=1 Tax=Granulicella rosea TaxID=474952 RepID=A0A239LLA9_9BACT|nr:hypothetical protein [Granulicella rosea]SNT31251.1 hypothetical protein SAMN05421770_107117 [Granulicella rosea]